MKRMPSRREWLLLGLTAIVVGLSLAYDGPSDIAVVEPEIVEKTGGTPRKPDAGTTVADLDVARLRRAPDVKEPGNAFNSRSWYVPPPPPPPPAKVEPPPPTAPPLPFSYLGRYVEVDAPVFFLARGDRVLTVKAGDILEGIYRVDGVEGSSLTLTYIPLNIKQLLDMGGAG